MPTSKIFYLVLLLIVGISVSAGVYFLFDNHNNLPGSQTVDNEPPLPFGQITRQERINHVDWAYANGKQYEQYSLVKDGEKKYVVTFYQPNYREKNLTQEDRRGGILVFEIESNVPKLIWESTDNITLTRPTIDVRDITGDGNAEILANWSNGKVSLLYIYSWSGLDFRLITPMKKVEGLIGGSGNLYVPIFGSSDDIQVRDLDNDSIEEVLLIRPSKTGEILTDVYKWDGSKYYLWKETTDLVGSQSTP